MSTLGADIQKRRKLFGFTVGELAKLSGLKASQLTAIESGIETPTTADIGWISDALACNAADLALGRADDPRRSLARFRGATTSKPLGAYDLRLLARAAEAGRILAHLLGRLGDARSLEPLRSPSAPSPAMEPWENGYQLGAAVREELDSSHKPLASVQELIEQLGVHVADVDFDDADIEAASLYETGAAPVILINRRASKYGYALARRAILAHELCHVLNDGGERNLTVVSIDEDRSSPIEQRANAFAPSFIAPGSWVSVKQAGPKAMALELAATWGLSFEGAAWHLKNLKRIDARAAERLKGLAPKPKFETDFERPLHRTPPDQFGIDAEPTQLALGLLSEMAIVAAEDGAISRGRAAEILSLQ